MEISFVTCGRCFPKSRMFQLHVIVYWKKKPTTQYQQCIAFAYPLNYRDNEYEYSCHNEVMFFIPLDFSWLGSTCYITTIACLAKQLFFFINVRWEMWKIKTKFTCSPVLHLQTHCIYYSYKLLVLYSAHFHILIFHPWLQCRALRGTKNPKLGRFNPLFTPSCSNAGFWLSLKTDALLNVLHTGTPNLMTLISQVL